MYILSPDSTRQLLQFDTGCSMFAGLYDYSFSSVVVLSDSLLHEFRKDSVRASSFSLRMKGDSVSLRDMIIYDGLQVQDVSIPYAVLCNGVPAYKKDVGYLAFPFLSYFDYMVYDREKKKVCFYNYNRDLPITEDMKEIFDKIRETNSGKREWSDVLKKWK